MEHVSTVARPDHLLDRIEARLTDPNDLRLALRLYSQAKSEDWAKRTSAKARPTSLDLLLLLLSDTSVTNPKDRSRPGTGKSPKTTDVATDIKQRFQDAGIDPSIINRMEWHDIIRMFEDKF